MLCSGSGTIGNLLKKIYGTIHQFEDEKDEKDISAVNKFLKKDGTGGLTAMDVQ